MAPDWKIKKELLNVYYNPNNKPYPYGVAREEDQRMLKMFAKESEAHGYCKKKAEEREGETEERNMATISVEFGFGEVDGIFKEAIRVAKTIDCFISFTVNGVHLIVDKDSKEENVKKDYLTILEINRERRM